jgi:DNA transformation protein
MVKKRAQPLVHKSAQLSEQPIESLRNLGPKSGQWLRQVGIDSIVDLKAVGPVLAYRRVKQRQPTVSLNLLWALAAGLQDQDWRQLGHAAKQQLLHDAGQASPNV